MSLGVGDNYVDVVVVAVISLMSPGKILGLISTQPMVGVSP